MQGPRRFREPRLGAFGIGERSLAEPGARCREPVLRRFEALRRPGPHEQPALLGKGRSGAYHSRAHRGPQPLRQLVGAQQALFQRSARVDETGPRRAEQPFLNAQMRERMGGHGSLDAAQSGKQFHAVGRGQLGCRGWRGGALVGH